MSLSVMPPRALTTTIMVSFFASFSTIFFKLRMLFTEPTDVPPNFNTFIYLVFMFVRPLDNSGFSLLNPSDQNTYNTNHASLLAIQKVANNNEIMSSYLRFKRI